MSTDLPHSYPVATPFLEIKVKPSEEEKRAIEAAAAAVQPFPLSLAKWVLLAIREKLERDGFAVEQKKARK